MTRRPSQRESDSEVAGRRIQALKRVTADYIARSYATCMSAGHHLPHVLVTEQNNYYTQFANSSPITVLNPHEGTLENLAHFDALNSPIMFIANHPPYEKTISPSRSQLETSLKALGRGDLIEGTDTPSCSNCTASNNKQNFK